MSKYTKVEEKMSRAKALLIMEQPFFGVAVTRRVIKIDLDIPTACVSPVGQITVNPEFIKLLSTQQVMFLLAHEAMHYMLAHALRRGSRDAMRFNVAADYVINDTLKTAGVGEMIPGGLWAQDMRLKSAEELYTELPEDAGQDGGGDGDGDKPFGGIGNDIGDATDGDGKPLDDAACNEIKAQAKVEMLQAAKAAKAMGKLPANIERLVDEMVAVQTPWHEILERFMHSKVRDGTSWTRPNRRFIGQGVYLPGPDFKPKMGEIVIAVDTSCSIGQRELNEFNGHIDRIMEMCAPEKIHVVYCDSQVNHVDEFTPEDYPVALSPHGGGGTRFEPVFNWVSQQGIVPECLIYLTDGYGDQNSFDAPSYDTIWLTTHSEEFNWGTVVKFETGVRS